MSLHIRRIGKSTRVLDAPAKGSGHYGRDRYSLSSLVHSVIITLLTVQLISHIFYWMYKDILEVSDAVEESAFVWARLMVRSECSRVMSSWGRAPPLAWTWGIHPRIVI